MGRPIRYPVLHHCLAFCKETCPNAFKGVVDIGVRYGTDFLMDIFPESHHYLFEPVVECRDKIHENYRRRKIDYSFYGIALTNVSVDLYLHQLSSDGSGNITHSEVSSNPTSNNSNLHSIVPIEGSRLDDLKFSPNLRPFEYLVKLDVDGIEELIIEGGQAVLRDSSFVVMEASVVRDNILTRLSLMKDLGFRLFDICDNAYYYNQLSCMDFVFINEKIRAKELRFRPWEYAKFQVHWEKWQQGYPDLATQPLPIAFN